MSKTTQESGLFSRSASKAIPWILISKLLLFFVYFGISVVLVRNLGADQYGVFVICRSIADLLILLCTLGMTACYLRFIPELAVQNNLAGIKRLLGKSTLIQLLLLAGAGIGLTLLQPQIESYFSVALNGALVFTFLMMVCEQFKQNLNALMTALYRYQNLTIFSIANGLFWLIAVVIFLESSATVESALSAQTVANILVYGIACIVLLRYLNSLNWKSPALSIGYRRVAQHSSSIVLTTFVRLLMLKYTELFFLGGARDAETVGLYDLAFSLPMMVIVFIPAALNEIFIAGFSEAYVKSKSCLPKLISSLYKTLILITVPVAVFGFYFAGDVLVYFYGEEVSPVAELTNWFCLLHLLPLISLPLSIALQVREKVMKMLPIMLLQLLVNMLLGYWMIVYLDLGIWGAFATIFLTFLLTIPVRLYIVARILGGIFFPMRFFLKILSASLICGACIRWFVDEQSLLLFALAFVAFVFLLFFFAGIARCITPRDLIDIDIFTHGKAQAFFTWFFSYSPNLQKRFITQKVECS